MVIDPTEFSNFIETSNIFEKTLSMMKLYITEWYAENTDDFLECMGSELEVVLDEYSFFNRSVHFVKNFNFDPPNQDYIHCIIDIKDKKGDIRTSYKAIFDYYLNAEDDTLC